MWSERIGVEMIRGQYNGDPAALCYDAYAAADEEERRVPALRHGRPIAQPGEPHEGTWQDRPHARQARPRRAPHERLLVVDATTGSNAVSQAREFQAAVGLTGLIVTKLDGSGKGGVLVAIQNELGIPTRFIGTGEAIDDFRTVRPPPFRRDDPLRSFLSPTLYGSLGHVAHYQVAVYRPLDGRPGVLPPGRW